MKTEICKLVYARSFGIGLNGSGFGADNMASVLISELCELLLAAGKTSRDESDGQVMYCKDSSAATDSAGLSAGIPIVGSNPHKMSASLQQFF